MTQPPRSLFALTLVALASLASAQALANDAEYSNYSGSPAPVQNDVIRMASETITFTERRGSWEVEARYVFENTSDEAVSLTMGYPEVERDNGGESFEKLKTRVRGKPVEITTKKPPKEQPWSGLGLGRAHLFDVRFEPGETVTIDHEFRMGSGGSVAIACESELSYITRTGRLWKGPIGKARFVIELRRVYDGVVLPEGYEIASYERRVVEKAEPARARLVLEMQDWVPRHDLQLTLMQPCGGEGQIDSMYTGGACPDLRWPWASERFEGRVRAHATTHEISTKKARQKLAIEALAKFDSDQLRLCRNLVYARYGYSFKDPKLQERFYFHEPGAKLMYPPQHCLEKKSKGDELPPYCHEERVILYTPDEDFTPNMLGRQEMRYVTMLRDEERRRKRRSSGKESKTKSAKPSSEDAKK